MSKKRKEKKLIQMKSSETRDAELNVPWVMVQGTNPQLILF